MLIFVPATACVIKPTMLLRERVVVADWISVSSSVTQREFAEVLRNNNKSMGTSAVEGTHSFKHAICRAAG